MKAMFFIALVMYGVAVILEFTGTAFKKDRLLKFALYIFWAAFAVHTGFIIVRGVAAKRLPLSNQFEFANAFAWGVALMLIVMRRKLKTDWLSVVAMPATLLVMTYAALQPMEIKDLMPALRSAWFGVHIGSAVLSYAAFVIMDYLSYRMVAFGFLFLTVVILSGAIWAEQAWSAFWTWDPKEVWALITWIIYAVFLHLRLRSRKKGTFMAWYLVIAVPVVFFTFAGVNTFMHGLHTYG